MPLFFVNRHMAARGSRQEWRVPASAISFVSTGTHAHFRLIEKRHRLNLPREQIGGGGEPVEAEVPAPSAGGIKKASARAKRTSSAKQLPARSRLAGCINAPSGHRCGTA